MNKLVDAGRLLEELFEQGCRPSMRWLRGQQKAKTIPYIKIGRLVFFDVEKVRIALANKNTVEASDHMARGRGRPKEPITAEKAQYKAQRVAEIAAEKALKYREQKQTSNLFQSFTLIEKKNPPDESSG